MLLLVLIPLTGQSQEVSGEAYTLRIGDQIRIEVFNEPDLSSAQKLDQEGVVIVPLLGRTQLLGKTLRQAEDTLRDLYISEEYLIDPQVTVTMMTYAEQTFSIFGEVKSPGVKPFPPGRQSIDILEAITLAGDLTQYAKRNEILLRRPNKTDKTEEKFTINLDDLIRGNRRSENTLVEVIPEDIIYVPERMF